MDKQYVDRGVISVSLLYQKVGLRVMGLQRTGRRLLHECVSRVEIAFLGRLERRECLAAGLTRLSNQRK